MANALLREAHAARMARQGRGKLRSFTFGPAAAAIRARGSVGGTGSGDSAPADGTSADGISVSATATATTAAGSGVAGASAELAVKAYERAGLAIGSVAWGSALVLSDYLAGARAQPTGGSATAGSAAARSAAAASVDDSWTRPFDEFKPSAPTSRDTHEDQSPEAVAARAAAAVTAALGADSEEVGGADVDGHASEWHVELDGARVIELGAGVGLCGLVAAARGASVLLTDTEELQPLLRDNIGIADNKAAVAASGGSIVAETLSWGRDLPAHVRGAVGSGTGAGGGVQLDVVLGADIVYRKESFGPLLQTLDTLIPPGSDATFLLGYRRRGEDEDQWFSAMERLGFRAQVVYRGTAAMSVPTVTTSAGAAATSPVKGESEAGAAATARPGSRDAADDDDHDARESAPPSPVFHESLVIAFRRLEDATAGTDEAPASAGEAASSGGAE